MCHTQTEEHAPVSRVIRMQLNKFHKVQSLQAKICYFLIKVSLASLKIHGLKRQMPGVRCVVYPYIPVIQTNNTRNMVGCAS